VVSLDDNFRSTPQVLAVAGAVIASGSCGVPGLRPHRPDGPLPSVRAYDTDADEARGIARAVRDRHRPGGPWSHVAVLTRTNAQLVTLEQAFQAAGIPVRVRGGRAFLERPEVKGALAELAAGPASLAMGLADVATAAGRCGAGPAPLVDDAGPAPYPGHGGPADERRASLEELVRLGHDYLALEADGAVAGFAAWLSASLRSEASRGVSDAVELATFHAAKGLEWPVVFLAGLEHGLVPISHAATEEARDEERRLLYVAVTRAQSELHCSWARRRTFGARNLRRRPSPWLEEIEAARATLAAGQARPGTTQWKARFAAERSRLRGDEGERGRRAGVQVGRHADPALLAALERWRSGAARAGGVPAFVVLHDTTLAALAEAQPLTTDSLLAVPGLGPLKASRYGPALLEVVAGHQCQREPLTSSPNGARKEP
jgi:DNA helicase-2/ATP-dependent DNA helicase PcrA